MFAEAEKLDEQNEWFCPNCRTFVQADKKIDIWSVPEILIVHLKRFSAGPTGHKIDTFVDFPDEMDLTPYVVGPHAPEQMTYVLYAVSEHSGSLMGGHYTAHAIVASEGTSEWYSFNDSSCFPASAPDAHNARAYVLFYQRKATVGFTNPQPSAAIDPPTPFPTSKSGDSFNGLSRIDEADDESIGDDNNELDDGNGGASEQDLRMEDDESSKSESDAPSTNPPSDSTTNN
jgi:hypothetical protein